MIHLSRKNSKIDAVIELTRSKSESNRALILAGLFPDQIQIHHLSDSDDTLVMMEALAKFKEQKEINVGHAGTSFRFLTAFLAIQQSGEWILTGSERMKERPIGILVEALKKMGADITYLEKDGFPPLKICGVSQLVNRVVVDANVSSQYISALMLIGSKIPGGLEILLKGEITSQPYLMMTFSMMQELGIGVGMDWEDQKILVEEKDHLLVHEIEIEGDWSAASYWFSIVALGEIGSTIKLKGLNKNSRQGDSRVVSYYLDLGVQAEFKEDRWVLQKIAHPKVKSLKLDLADTPDVAQTLVCTCAGLGIGVKFSGLHTLRIKETDRMLALQLELAKFGVDMEIFSDDELLIRSGQSLMSPTESVATYKDHRIAMAFAPLAMKVDLSIENEEVVSKSYPEFWKDFSKVINVRS
ncbi:MAG: 3-phosphoshikimate 1-carboxyvinyltransferase [Flavobacteriales bacterium]|nr:3-phosphoshikimate 1-carboxyvinyltransferase [Flavobacteriales bacterium]